MTSNQEKNNKYIKQKEENGKIVINNTKNHMNLKGKNSPSKTKEQMEKLITEQSQNFKSPVPKKKNFDGDDYNYKSQNGNIEICKTCGKSKKPIGELINEKSKKSIIRELISEEKEDNNFIIRYAKKIEIQNEPHFESFSTSGTHFCPIHGYV